MTRINQESKTIRRLVVGISIFGGVGLLTSIVLSIMEGVKYRIREEQGLDPVWAPDWVARLTEVGIYLFLIAIVALGILGIVALRRRRSGLAR